MGFSCSSSSIPIWKLEMRTDSYLISDVYVLDNAKKIINICDR